MKKVLIIDDDLALRLAARMALSSPPLGMKVLEAEDTENGLRIAHEQKPDLVLCDIGFPHGSGFEVVEGLTRIPDTAGIPVILITGMQDPSYQRLGMDAGADDFLRKPFTGEELVLAVKARLRKKETQLQEQCRIERQLLALLEATTELVAVIEPRTHRVIYLNRTGRKMLEVGPVASGAAINLADFYDGDVSPAANSVELAEACGRWSGEAQLVGRHGRCTEVYQQIHAHRDETGEVDFLSLVASDITSQKQAEQDRKRIEVQLRHAQKMESVGRLAAGIAHEINTPIQYIGDNVHFIPKAFADIDRVLDAHLRLVEWMKSCGPLPAAAGAILQPIEKIHLDYLRQEIPQVVTDAIEGVDRVNNIVRAMKDFSHPGVQEKRPVDLNRAIESTLTVSRNEWKYVAEMITRLDPDLPPVPCLPGEFNQVILNLVVNAAHAIADVIGTGGATKGTITVTTRADGDWVEVRVSDTGCGIPEAIRHRIFEPFFTTKEVGKGTGQGLALAHAVIVERHGGTIDFVSETGRGTTFIVRLPATAAAAAIAEKTV